MPYLAVLSDFREGVRKIAREQKGKNLYFDFECPKEANNSVSVESEKVEKLFTFRVPSGSH